MPPNEPTTCLAKPGSEKAVPPKKDEPSKPFVAVPPEEEQPYNPLVTDVNHSGPQPAKSKSADQEVILVYPFIAGEAIEEGCF